MVEQVNYGTVYQEVPVGPPVWVQDYTAPSAVLPSAPSMLAYPTTTPAVAPAAKPTVAPAAVPKSKKVSKKPAKKGCC